jgi:hypothetical protein
MVLSALAHMVTASAKCQEVSIVNSVHGRLLVAFGCLILISMTSAAQSPNLSDKCRSERFYTSSLYDAPTKQNIYFVPSSGFIADRTFIAVSVANGPSAPAKELASWLMIAEECPLQLTVAGKNESKTVRVIKDALVYIGKVELHALDFTFVGSQSAASSVEKLVTATGGTFHTRLKLDQ